MGYASLDYFNIEFALVDENKIREVEEFFNSLDPKTTGFHGVKLPVKDGELLDIKLDEYYREYPDVLLFAEKLREALIDSSIELVFTDRDGYDEIQYVDIRPDEVISYQRMDVPDYCQPLYCNKCGTFIGYIRQEEQDRLGKICAKCARE